MGQWQRLTRIPTYHISIDFILQSWWKHTWIYWDCKVAWGCLVWIPELWNVVNNFHIIMTNFEICWWTYCCFHHCHHSYHPSCHHLHQQQQQPSIFFISEICYLFLFFTALFHNASFCAHFFAVFSSSFFSPSFLFFSVLLIHPDCPQHKSHLLPLSLSLPSSSSTSHDIIVNNILTLCCFSITDEICTECHKLVCKKASFLSWSCIFYRFCKVSKLYHTFQLSNQTFYIFFFFLEVI